VCAQQRQFDQASTFFTQRGGRVHGCNTQHLVMTPAGDESTIDSEKESFSMGNIVPQDHQLNIGIWAKIEADVRVLATNLGDVYVVTGPAFSASSIPTIGKDAVAVAVLEYTWKAVYEPGIGAAAYVSDLRFQ